jgi:Icc-related predicted phosphoesterase
MRLICISDTHTATPTLPEGDVLLHAGDLTYQGKTRETKKQLEWIASQPHTHKIIVPGNHELDWEKGYVPASRYCAELGITLLIDKGITINGIKFYGSPRTPEFCGWAYMHEGEEIAQYWGLIPDDTDVLITHGPPRGILDKTLEGEECGCPYLRKELDRIKPKVHLFGHIHEGYGARLIDGTNYINAAIMNRQYCPVNSPIEIEVKGKE